MWNPFSGLTGYIIVAGGVAIGSLWAMHIYDEARYARLQAQVAQANATRLSLALKDQADLYEKIIRGQAVAQSALVTAVAEEKARAGRLKTAFDEERKRNATLARCLSTRLPAAVLRELPH